MFEGPVRGQSLTGFSNITGRRNGFRPHHLSANNLYGREGLNLLQPAALGSEHFKKELAEI
jgi:hypothetical protein